MEHFSANFSHQKVTFRNGTRPFSSQAGNLSDLRARVSPQEEGVFIFLSVMSVGLVVCGIFCSLFILATVRYSRLLTASSVLIGNLCLCTLLYTILVLPVHVMTLLAQDSVVGDCSVICKAVSFLHVTVNMASANAHIAIAMHRFCIVRLSAKYPTIRSRGFAWLLATASWFPAVVTNAFPLFGLGAHHGFDRKLFRCTFGPPAARAYALFSRLTLGIVPLLVMVLCYAAIYWLLFRTQRQLGVSMSRSARQPAKLRSAQRDRQATRICFLACLGFLAFYLPNAVYGLLSHFQVVNSTTAGLVCNQFQIIGLATNPLLYALFSTDLRVAMVSCVRQCRWPTLAKSKVSTTASGGGTVTAGGPRAFTETPWRGNNILDEPSNIQARPTKSTPF